MSSTIAKPMKGAAVSYSPRIAYTMHAYPQNMLPIVNRLGSRYTPRRNRRRGGSLVRRRKRSRPSWLRSFTWLRAYECSTAMTVSPPRTVSPTATLMVALSGRNTSMREPNFMMPKRSPGAHVGARLDAADHAPRQDPDDLPRDDRLAAVVDPDLAALVHRRGVVAIRRAETARA